MDPHTGRVLAMVFGAGVSDEQAGFAITAAELADVLDTGVGQVTPVPNGDCRIRD